MDLAKQPPRRPSNTCMGGLVNLARMTDKARAYRGKRLDDYVYGAQSGLDAILLEFLGIESEAFADAAACRNDTELAEWVRDVSGKTDAEIEVFNQGQLTKVPKDEAAKQRLKDRLARYAPGRTDIRTVLQSIELDDWGAFREADLTGRAPKSPYVRDAAGIYGVARMADKGRADKAGKVGEYKYNCPVDQAILGFLEISAEDFQEAAYQNPNDLELGAWVLEHTSRTGAEILAFNARMAAGGPETEEQRAHFRQTIDELAPGRVDITTWFGRTDLDDEVTFNTVDLTRHAPRSPYDESVGGIVALARMIDKGRAVLAGTLGEYWSGKNSGVDSNVLRFLGVSAEDFYAALPECPTDADVLAWLESRGRKTEAEIAEFNAMACSLGVPDDLELIQQRVAVMDPSRTDIVTWFGLMQLDDRVSFARLKAGV